MYFPTVVPTTAALNSDLHVKLGSSYTGITVVFVPTQIVANHHQCILFGFSWQRLAAPCIYRNSFMLHKRVPIHMAQQSTLML